MRITREPRPPRGGFSFIELLCVLAILLIVFALSFGVGGKARQQSRLEESRGNLSLLHQALRIAAAENGERFPTVAGATDSDTVLSRLVPRYSSRVDLFRCPGRTRDPFTGASATTQRFRNHFAYASGLGNQPDATQWLLSDEQVDTRRKAIGDRIFSETDSGLGSNHGQHGGSILFTDGHAAFSAPKAAFAIQIPPGAIALNPAR
jgi:prepilin-type N-terminal cleavage/methylation domain-containing protein